MKKQSARIAALHDIEKEIKKNHDIDRGVIKILNSKNVILLNEELGIGKNDKRNA